MLLAVGAAGCGAVYPEIATPVRDAPEGRVLDPPPPEDLYFIVFEGAEIPRQTRDGRKWDSVGGSAPDPIAMLYIDENQVLKTPVESNTLTPTWPDQDKGNYEVPDNAKIRIELWDSNPLNNSPICVKRILSFQSEMGGDPGRVLIKCESGARIRMKVIAAKPKLGLGMWYELRTKEIFVTRVQKASPAERAGIRGGDQIVAIQGRGVSGLDEAEARSLINANAQLGLELRLKRKGGEELDVKVKEGPIYSLHKQTQL